MKFSNLAHSAMKNRRHQQTSNEAVCFHCANLFRASDVKEYTDSGETALCPKCGVDAVLFESSGHPMNLDFAEGAMKYWFGKQPTPRV